MTDRAPDTSDKPSKSARKRAAHQVRKLADDLVAMKASALAQVPLPEHLRKEIGDARQMSSHGALRRQKQYIARLLRDVPLDDIQASLHSTGEQDRVSRRRFHEAERYRDILLRGQEMPPAATESLDAGTLDKIHALVTDYHAAQTERQRKHVARTLFRTLHDALGRQGEDRHE